MKQIIALTCWLTFLAASFLRADEAGDLVLKGDTLDRELKTQEALAAYLGAEKLKAPDAHLLCQIAKQYAESMTDTTDIDKKNRLGNQALVYAKRAVAAGPNDSTAHLSLAIAYGRLALLADNRTKIDYSRHVKEQTDIGLKLNPESDVGWHVLGVWTHNMANLNPFLKACAGMVYGKLPDASNEDAVRYFQKAIALNPRQLGSHVELGKTWLSMGRKEDARKELALAVSMPVRQRDDAEAKSKGRALLENL